MDRILRSAYPLRYLNFCVTDVSGAYSGKRKGPVLSELEIRAERINDWDIPKSHVKFDISQRMRIREWGGGKFWKSEVKFKKEFFIFFTFNSIVIFFSYLLFFKYFNLINYFWKIFLSNYFIHCKICKLFFIYILKIIIWKIKKNLILNKLSWATFFIGGKWN